MTNERPKFEKKMMQSIRADRIMLLNENLLFSIPANFICFLIVFIGLYPEVNHTYLFIWFITAVFTCVLHGVVYIVNRIHSFPTNGYLKFLIGLAILYGALWGVAGSILIPQNNLLYQMLVIIISIGVASGGLHTLQPNMTASILFLNLIILPISFWLFLQNTPTYFLLGIAILIYLCFVLMVSWMGNKLLNTNIRLRYENLDLINRLISNNAILEESESRFRSAFNFAAIGMALLSLEGKWLKVNQSLCQIVGYTEEELLKIDFQTITHPDDLELDLNYVHQLLTGEISSYSMEKRYIKKDGSVIWILLSGSLIRNHENKPLYFIALIQNIDAQKQAEQELKYIAYHDVLTGLANRKQLDASFKLAISYAKRHKNQIAVLFMDLDHFKEINDTFGHDIGDLVLIEIGLRLKKTIRSTDILIRQGGDEFIIALTDISDVSQIEMVATKILATIARPIKIKRHQFVITVSIGISIYPKDGQDFNTLIKQADKALYIVKSEGRNNFRYF
ncbi:GGDEF domain-containing protein [Legionella bononiensis]|uniref:Diguanylate cyclase n=1 Tax=Legionella bononiensis TaxID=2793102 RepID=A0ABS1WEI1_9GAMM|nr:GGDEF domain-containing protein [Legionella bononiensis]MBL7479331.1 diguanylate cyclase [Legionella bononiensis]MBL7479349.1 diguanylate cyclase [Legionella bononiensis]MBL7527765.1 diguanylate cyclase [Legionella bononiensis]MBL7563554.1 diguanylate cyclase [Legionella bononiensis]